MSCEPLSEKPKLESASKKEGVKRTNKMTDYWGFLIEKPIIEPNQEGVKCVKIAVFRGQDYMRHIYNLVTNDEISAALGDIVRFKMGCPTELLGQDSEIVILPFENKLCEIIRENGGEQDLTVYKIDKLPVNQTDIRDESVYFNSEFGPIRMSEKDFVTGHRFQTVFFKIKKDDTSSKFELELVHSGTPEIGPKSPTVAEKENLKFEKTATVLKIEMDLVDEADTETWQKIGAFRLLQFSESLYHGPRPVFQLIDESKLDMFRGVTESCMIKMFHVMENDEGQLVKSNENEYFTGYLFFHVEPDSCVILMEEDNARKFERRFSPDEIFIFENEQNRRAWNFWHSEQYKHTGGLFQHSLNGENRPQLMDQIDALAMSAEELKDMKDPMSLHINQLNDEQKKAFMMAINEKRKIVCIQGPPGTGKTVVLANVVAKSVSQKKRVVVMTPTKEALYNIQSAVLKSMLKFCKNLKGENILMTSAEYNSKLELHFKSKEGLDLVNALKSDFAQGLITQKELDDQCKKIRNERLDEVTKEIMKGVLVVFSTITSSFVHVIVKRSAFDPDLCVVDEASQVMEATTWPGVFNMKRIVFAGDPKQLPALVFSKEAKNFELNLSVMDRIMAHRENHSWIMLKDQYRCHKSIIQWSSDSFYEGRLNTVCKEKTLQWMMTTSNGGCSRLFDTLVMIDTSLETDGPYKPQYWEQLSYPGTDDVNPRQYVKNGFSYMNKGEARLVVRYVEELMGRIVNGKTVEIAVITPYKGQKEMIEQMMAEKLPQEKCPRIGTIDSFQGQEFDIVVLSLVRSNPKLTMGFVSNVNRMNVAMTRAKLQVVIIANGFLMSKSNVPEIRKLFEMIDISMHRFPPMVLYKNDVLRDLRPTRYHVKHNFGKNFEDFYEETRDLIMKEFIIEYNKRREDIPARKLKEEKRGRHPAQRRN